MPKALGPELKKLRATNLRDFIPLNHKVLLNNISRFSSYLLEETLHLYYINQSVNAAYGSKLFIKKNHTRLINALCGKRNGILILKQLLDIVTNTL